MQHVKKITPRTTFGEKFSGVLNLYNRATSMDIYGRLVLGTSCNLSVPEVPDDVKINDIFHYYLLILLLIISFKLFIRPQFLTFHLILS